MRRLNEWSMPRVVTTAWGWVACTLLAAFLTPTGQFLLHLNATLRAEGSANVELPIAALRVWFVLTPLCAFLPAFALLFTWWRQQKRAEPKARRGE
jgi:hypothetical protein